MLGLVLVQQLEEYLNKMTKKIGLIILVSVLFIVSIAFWFLLPNEGWQWLKFSSLGASVSLLLCMLFVWGFLGRKNKSEENENEQKILLKKDIRVMKKIFHYAYKKIWGNGHQRTNTFYDLPWYLVLGGEKESNSSLLRQNGLEQIKNPYFDEEKASQFLRFWSNEHFIVIEVGPSIFDEDGIDDVLWKTLSSLLLKYRPRQGLNGILPVISSELLLTGTRNDCQKRANIYQEAILLMNSRLMINTPVYCILSDASAISDFSTFFAGFSGLGNAFGITLPCDPLCRFDRDEFERQSRALLKNVLNRQSEILRNLTPEDSNSVMALPFQLSVFLERVTELLHDLGSENRVRDAVWIRGFYLLSSSSHALEHDLLTQIVASKTESNFVSSRHSKVKLQNYFASNIFTQVILPQKKIVGINKKNHALYVASRLIIVLSMFSFLSVVAFILKNNWNRDEAWRTDGITQNRLYNNEMSKINASYSILDVIVHLDKLRIVATEGIIPTSWYEKVSIKQEKTAAFVFSEYQEKLKYVLLPKLADLISSELKVYIKLGDASKVFETLRLYKMLFDKEILDVNDINNYLVESLQEQGDVNTESLQVFSALLNDLLNSQYEGTITENKELIALALNDIDKISPERLIYARIKSLPSYKITLDLRRQFGDEFDSIFMFSDGYHGYLAPEIFTKQGYKELDLSVNSKLLKDQLKYFKLIQGDFSGVSISELMALSKQIQRFYFSDYVYYWKNLLNNIKVRPFGNPRLLSLAIKKASNPTTSPMIDLLSAVVSNTTLAIEEKPDLKAATKLTKALGLKGVSKGLGKAKKADKLAGNKLLRSQPSFVVNEAFNAFSYYLNGEEGDNETQLDGLITQFDSLNSYLDVAYSSVDSGKIYHEYALSHVNKSEDQLVLFQRFANKGPEKIEEWVKNISHQVWVSIVDGSMSYINEQWNKNVYQHYVSGIEARFPFTAQGIGEVAIEDFVQMFKPKGRVDEFLETFLIPFVSWENGALKVNKFDDVSFALNSASLKQIERAKQIGNIFFAKGGNELRLRVGLKANLMSTNVTEFQIRETENIFTYKHGPRIWSVVDWPKLNMDPNITISFYQNNNRVASKSYFGHWALFRFLFEGEISTTPNRLVRKSDYIFAGNKKMALDYSLLDSNVVLEPSLFTQFYLPKAL